MHKRFFEPYYFNRYCPWPAAPIGVLIGEFQLLDLTKLLSSPKCASKSERDEERKGAAVQGQWDGPGNFELWSWSGYGRVGPGLDKTHDINNEIIDLSTLISCNLRVIVVEAC